MAATELALMAGADRVEGTLFGNGERTGNVDIVTLALNMYTHNIDPQLDFSHINRIKRICESVTKMKVEPRHPYAGELVFTAFSGSHQDAIRKGFKYMADTNSRYWEVPYLPINPADIHREYEPVIRINSQSGKGGAAFVMQQAVGYYLPRNASGIRPYGEGSRRRIRGRTVRQPDRGTVQQKYVDYRGKYELGAHKVYDNHEGDEDTSTIFEGDVKANGTEMHVTGNGNGPIDAFFNALNKIGVDGFEFINYHEHAISQGSNSKAISYIELKKPDGKHIFGVGIHPNINTASLLGIINAINRAIGQK